MQLETTHLETITTALLILGILAIGGGLFGFLIFRPLYRRTGISFTGSPFRLLDFILLAAQVQVLLAIELSMNSEDQLHIPRLLVGIGLLCLCWLNGIWLLARASVENVFWRLFFFAILGPTGFGCGVIWTALIASLTVEQLLSPSLKFWESVMYSSSVLALFAVPTSVAVHYACLWIANLAKRERASKDGIEFRTSEARP